VRVVVLLAVLVVLIVVLLPLLRRPAVAARRAPRELHDELVKDPVCQTYVVRSRAVTGRRGVDGAPYFCSTDCARRYSG
jgi:YHS domain-containing protein